MILVFGFVVVRGVGLQVPVVDGLGRDVVAAVLVLLD